MAPKAKRAGSPGPKAKAKAKAPKAKAAPEPEVDPKALLEQEGKEMFEKYQEEGAGVKLKGFAQCIRDMNVKKCQIWTDDEIGPDIIKKQWKDLDGPSKKEVSEADFVAWWPAFMEIVEARKAETEAAAEKKEAEKKEQVAAKASLYDSAGIWKIPLKDLNEAINEAYQRNKTPLIIDNTENQRAETFFVYSGAHIIECKKLIVEKAKGKPVTELLEEVRDSFFKASCFKYGQTVVFRLANSACDIKGTFNNEVFPALSLLDAAQVNKVLGPENADNWKGSPFEKMCATDDDRAEPSYVGVNEKFRIVAITQFQEEDYVGFLEKMFPLDLCQPIKPNAD